MRKVLVISEPNIAAMIYDFNEENIKRFQLDKDEIQMLEEDKVVWHGDVGFEIDYVFSQSF